MTDQSARVPPRLAFARSPFWVRALVAGALFGLGFGVFAGFYFGSALGGVVAGLVGALLFGPAMAAFTGRMNQRVLAQLGPVPPGSEREVLRAAARGPVPTDPDVRAAALRLATARLQETTGRNQRPVAVILGVCAVVEAATAVLLGNPWLWLAVVLFSGLLVVHLVQPARLRRRIAELRGD